MTNQWMEFEAAIIGGGTGGVAAALALAQAGHRVVLTEEHPWIGGQLTSQAVPPDEHGWIEERGCTRSYRQFRDGVRETYRRHYPLRPEHRAAPFLNPGNGWVSPICHEPLVALHVLEGMLAPYLSNGQVHLLRGYTPTSAVVEGDRVVSVRMRNARDAREVELRAQFFMDATELGELLPLTGCEWVSGSEARGDTGEPGAPATARPGNQQAFSVCFLMEHRAEEDGKPVGEPPEGYETWRNYVPPLSPPWPGPFFSLTVLNPRTMVPMDYRFAPHDEPVGLFSGLWSFRRVIDRSLFAGGFYPSDLCLVNWPMIDYLGGTLTTGDPEEKARHLAAARQQSLCFFHWLRAEAPRPDGGRGWPGLRLRGDLLGSADGLAMAPYIRESRRIKARTTIREQDVSAACRPGERFGARYEDSVGIGYYRIDLHPSSGGDNYLDVESLPFQIPLGALLPVRLENLVAGAKNIGTTHITNGCYRLHPVEWNIGEAGGHLLAYCLKEGLPPGEVHATPAHLRRYQQALRERGVELEWPQDLNLAHADPHRHAMASISSPR